MVIHYCKPASKTVAYEVEVRAREINLLPALLVEYAEITKFDADFCIESVSSERQGNAKEVNMLTLLREIEAERYQCAPKKENRTYSSSASAAISRPSQVKQNFSSSFGKTSAGVQKKRHSYLDSQTKEKLDELSRQSGRSIPNIIRHCADSDQRRQPVRRAVFFEVEY